MVFVHATAASLSSRRAWPALLSLVLAGVLFGGASEASAQGRRARMSEDLRQRVRAGDFRDTSVIFTGSQERVDRLAARHGLRVRKRLSTGAVLEVPAGSLDAVTADSEVDQLSGNHVVRSQMTVTNEAIGADQVQAGLWTRRNSGLSGAGVGVAVIDSGVAAVPELSGRIVARRDFTDSRGRGLDEYGHGTHVAGIIAAAGRNRYDDTRGVAPGAHIISLKVLDANGAGTVDNVVEAIDWAIANRKRFNIRVINMSLGGPVLQPWRDDPLCQAVERAYRAGIVVVAAAGNLGKTADEKTVFGGITTPGISPHAITVGALNTNGTPWRSDDEVASYSSKGPTRFDHLVKPDVLAPGNKIRGLFVAGSTLARTHPELVIRSRSGTLLQLSGTSMAAPAVSGTVAGLLEAHAVLQPNSVRFLVQYSAEPLKEGLLTSGAGSLNFLAAVKLSSRATVVRETRIAGETVNVAGLVFGHRSLFGASQNILWGTDENILWGTADNILWGTDENILWGTDENILWGTDENILWGTDENILWGTDENILWGTDDENILWGTDENILWGTDENILWGTNAILGD